MEIILKIALVLVVSDQGNFLLRKSLIRPFPTPNTKEYIVESSSVIIKLFKVLSLKNKKKNSAVPNDIQSNEIKYLRFMIRFLSSKLIFNKGI
jgi:hypothetical protein